MENGENMLLKRRNRGITRCKQRSITIDEFAHAVRNHWMIEDQFHWILDVTMNKN